MDSAGNTRFLGIHLDSLGAPGFFGYQTSYGKHEVCKMGLLGTPGSLW